MFRPIQGILLVSAFTATVAFSASGSALPAQGGAAGKDYLAYVAAMRKGDLDGVAKTMSKSRSDDLMAHRKEPQFKMLFGFMQSQTPKDPKYIKGESEGNKATLTYAGKNDQGEALTITARMVREGGAWKLEKNESSNVVK